MVQHIKKKRTFYVPIILLVLLIGLLTLHNAMKERNLTPDGLSRNTEVLEGAKGKVLSAQKVGSDYDLHINEKDHLTNVQVNDMLEVTSKKELPLKISLKASYWAKQDHVYLYDDEQKEVIYYDGSDKKTIVKGVDGFKSSTDTVYYWKKNQVYGLDPSTGKAKGLLKTDDPVSDVFPGEDEGLFAVTIEKEDFTSDVHVYQQNNKQIEKKGSFNISQISGQTVASIDLARNQQGIHALYMTEQMHAGTITRRGYYGLLQKGTSEDAFHDVRIYDDFSKQRLREINELKLNVTDSNPEIIFSARGMINSKKESWNIYLATLTNKEWMASPISSTMAVSRNQVQADKGEMFWLDQKGKNVKVMAVSDNKTLVEQSNGFTWGDWIQGFYTGISTLPYGFIMMMVALIWIFPSILFLFSVSFLNEDAIEKRRNWVRYSTVLLFTVCQYFLLQQFFTPVFEVFSPLYLSFDGNSIVLPFLFVLLSIILTQMVRKKHWNLFQEFGYFTLFHTVLVLFLISPYVVKL